MVDCPRCGAVMAAHEVTCPQCGSGLEHDGVYRTDYDPRELLILGLSPQFVEFVFLDPKPARLSFWCEPRDAGWACYVPKDVSSVYPLWTCNADVTALWIRRGRLEYVKLYHDDPEFMVLARTEQGLLLELFRCLLESDDWHDPEQSLHRLREMAEVAGFRHLSELHEWCEQNGSANDYHERWDRFVESLSNSPPSETS